MASLFLVKPQKATDCGLTIALNINICVVQARNSQL